MITSKKLEKNLLGNHLNEKFGGKKLNENRRFDKKIKIAFQIVALRVNVCNYDSAIERVAELNAAKKRRLCLRFNSSYGDGKVMITQIMPRRSTRLIFITPDGMPLVWMQKTAR